MGDCRASADREQAEPAERLTEPARGAAERSDTSLFTRYLDTRRTCVYDGWVIPAERLTTCERCERSGMSWQRSHTGILYLAEPDGGEHYRRCSGVAYAEPAEPVAVAAMIAAAEPVADNGEAAYAATLAALERAEAEAMGDELERAEAERSAYAAEAERACDWPTLRRAILAYGGIGPSPDFPRDWYPGGLYRASGKPPDLVAAEAMHPAPWGNDGDDSAMFDYLHRSWNQWQQAQSARRPRRAVSRPVAQALAEPVAAAEPARELIADVARMVADVAALAALEPARYASMARAVADLAAMVRDS